jgi:hypothetical protein
LFSYNGKPVGFFFDPTKMKSEGNSQSQIQSLARVLQQQKGLFSPLSFPFAPLNKYDSLPFVSIVLQGVAFAHSIELLKKFIQHHPRTLSPFVPPSFSLPSSFFSCSFGAVFLSPSAFKRWKEMFSGQPGGAYLSSLSLSLSLSVCVCVCVCVNMCACALPLSTFLFLFSFSVF